MHHAIPTNSGGGEPAPGENGSPKRTFPYLVVTYYQYFRSVGGSQRESLCGLYFKTHRQAYYDHLQLVRETGDWEEWIQYKIYVYQKYLAILNEGADPIRDI